MDAAAEGAAVVLAQHADYRVLRRIIPRNDPRPEGLKLGLYVDVEATGLDTARDHVIQLAMVPFWFDTADTIVAVQRGMSWLHDPGIPIPEKITELTGITDAMVQGHTIPDDIVHATVQGAALVIAHNADYDRKMCERRWPAFARMPWACSYQDVPWRETFGCACGKLAHLVADTCGAFYDAHRALDDCCAGVHLLSTAAHGGRTAFAMLLERARQPTYRISAGANMPSAFNELLKERKYRWHDGKTGRKKEWHRECTPAERVDEWKWLQAQGVTPAVIRFSAWDKYSIRVG